MRSTVTPIPRMPQQPQPAAATAHWIPRHAPESTHLQSAIWVDANIHEPPAPPKHRELVRSARSSLFPQSRNHCTLAHDDAGLHLCQIHDHRSSLPGTPRLAACLGAENENVRGIKLAIAIVEPVLNSSQLASQSLPRFPAAARFPSIPMDAPVLPESTARDRRPAGS